MYHEMILSEYECSDILVDTTKIGSLEIVKEFVQLN